MPELTEILKEEVGKSELDIIGFLNKKIKKKEINAYLPSGSSVVKITSLSDHETAYIEDPTTKHIYVFHSNSYGGMFNTDGDQTHYDHIQLARLKRNKNPKKKRIDFHSLDMKNIKSMMEIRHNTDFKAGVDVDYVGGTRGEFSIIGEKDPLYEKLVEFLKE